MKIILWSALLLISLANRADAQHLNSVLWEISGNGLLKKSYLFGTIHIAPSSVIAKCQKLQSIIRTSEVGLFETSGEVTDTLARKKGRVEIQEQPPLDQIFSPEAYQEVDAFFSKTPLGSIRPHNNNASLYGMLQVAMAYKSNQAGQVELLDDYIKSMLDSSAKLSYRLDDVNDTSIILFQSQYRDIANVLLSVIKQQDAAVAKAYIPGTYLLNLSADLKLENVADSAMANVTVKRNLLWISKIEEKMKNSACFIAVGLGHLQYRTGLIALLRKAGYQLKPVTCCP